MVLFLAGLFAGFLLGGLLIAIVSGPGRAPDCDNCYLLTRALADDRRTRPTAGTDLPFPDRRSRDRRGQVGGIRDPFDPLPGAQSPLGASFSVREEDDPVDPPR